MNSRRESRSRSVLNALGLSVALLSLPSAIRSADEVDFAKLSRDNFERIKDSTSLAYDWSAILSFVASAKGAVIDDLIQAYRQPPAEPESELRYLLATGIRLHYISEFMIRGGTLDVASAKRLVRFTSDECRANSDAWAAFNAFRALTSGDPRFLDPVKRAAREAANPFLRASAIEALGRRRDADLLGFLDEALAAAVDEKDQAARSLLVESLVWAIANTCAPKPESEVPTAPAPTASVPRRRFLGPGGASAEEDRRDGSRSAGKKSPKHVTDLKSMMRRLSGKALQPRTQRQAELALRHALGAEDEATVKRLLEEKKEPAPADSRAKKRGRTVVVAPPVEFMGIETRGERVLFLLDASDSMLKPLSEAERRILRELIEKDEAKQAASTPEKKSTRRGRTVVQSKSRIKKELSTNWDAVETRFDAARAHLKHTLSKMSSATTFAVLLFGDKAELLKITPRFVKASDKARLLVARELDRIKPGRKSPDFPHGRLRGQTNLYGAFALAFCVTTRGVVKKGEAYVDDRLLTKGADAFFLLSDGQPTIDGFSGRGPLIESEGYWSPATKATEITVTDPETGATKKVKVPGSPRQFVPASKGRANYPNGPFVTPEPLVDDVRRRNLFQRATLHAVGFGEADYDLLKRLSSIGHGRWIWIGEE